MHLEKKKFAALALVAVVSATCIAPAAFAAEPFTAPTSISAHPNNTMSPTKTVYPIGTKTFYKVSGTQVSFADRDDGTGYIAVPSAYISGSEYNPDNTAYGMYVTNDGTVHFVDLSLCAEDNGTYTWYHATKDSATVSSDVDTATNNAPTMGTDFYINIEKDAINPDGSDSEDVVIKGTNDPRIEYEITVSTKSSYQLNVTVPMFVCMYGYGGDGSIVEPTSDAYQLKNASTRNADTSATIVDVTKLTHYTKIYDENHSNEELYAIAYNKDNGDYMYWYSKPSTPPTEPNWVYNDQIQDLHLNASGECYVIYIDDQWHFKVGGVLEGDTLKETVSGVDSNHILTEDFVYGEWNFGTAPQVGDKLEGGKNEGMPVNISGIQAIPHTWKLVPMNKKATDLKRGELTMSIAPVTAFSNASAIDLSTASGKLDITERGWHLDAPELNDDGTVKTTTSLGLITKAQMAGGAINDAGCTSVVSVSYTVMPGTTIQNSETNSTVANGANSNR